MALTEKLKAIADAIRSKTGDSAPLTLDAMPSAIESISGGGGGEPITVGFMQGNVASTSVTVIHMDWDGNLTETTFPIDRRNKNGSIRTVDGAKIYIFTSDGTVGGATLEIINGMPVYVASVVNGIVPLQLNS